MSKIFTGNESESQGANIPETIIYKEIKISSNFRYQGQKSDNLLEL